jgi:hypothetical protein
MKDGTDDGPVTLRDHLAATCPLTIADTKIVAWFSTCGMSSNELFSAWCRLRYVYADEMLKARHAVATQVKRGG